MECSECIKKLKTVKGRDKTFSQFHTERARTWECPRENCTTQLNSLNAYHNHQHWHNGISSQLRRKIARERRKQQAQLKAYTKYINRKKAKSPRSGDPDYSAPSSKSAPAKVIPVRRSPRGHRALRSDGFSGENCIVCKDQKLQNHCERLCNDICITFCDEFAIL